MFKELSKQDKDFVLFYIRSELMIDGIPLIESDLESIIDESISAKTLLGKLLGLEFPQEDFAWQELINKALDARIDLEILDKVLDKDISFTLESVICSNCNWRGSKEELEVDIDNISITFCPDCGKKLLVKDEK